MKLFQGILIALWCSLIWFIQVIDVLNTSGEVICTLIIIAIIILMIEDIINDRLIQMELYIEQSLNAKIQLKTKLKQVEIQNKNLIRYNDELAREIKRLERVVGNEHKSNV